MGRGGGKDGERRGREEGEIQEMVSLSQDNEGIGRRALMLTALRFLSSLNKPGEGAWSRCEGGRGGRDGGFGGAGARRKGTQIWCISHQVVAEHNERALKAFKEANNMTEQVDCV